MASKGSGSAPAPAVTPQVSRKVETGGAARGEKNRRSLGARYLQSRTRTPSSGSGLFGGTKQTLG